MVKSDNPSKSSILSACPPSPQATSPSIGESPDSLNLISQASSRAGKHVHPRGCSDVCCTVRYSSRSVSAAEDSRKAFSEFSFSSEKKESKKEISPGPRTSIVSRIIAGKLSSNRVVPLQLSATPSPSAPEERTHSMSWDNQVAAEQSRRVTSGNQLKKY